MLTIAYINLEQLNIKIESIDNEEKINIQSDDLVFKAPILSGYGFVGINRLSVYYDNIKSQSGGGFAHYMKCNGYDYIVIKGKCYHPVHIHINREKIKILDATNVYNYDFSKIMSYIENKLNNKDIEIATIGISAVSGVQFSKIIFNNNKSCGKQGLGMLMGNKNLKCISLQRQPNLQPSNINEFSKLNSRIAKRITDKDINTFFYEENNCYGCCLNCKSSVIKKIMQLGFSTKDANEINKISDTYGMDSVTFGSVLLEYRNINYNKHMGINEFAREFINNYEEHKHLYKNKIKKDKEFDDLEQAGFCKFLINKNIINKNEVDLLIKYIFG